MESVARSVSNNTKQLIEVNAKLQDLNTSSGGNATEAKQDDIISELQDIYSETVPINAQTSSIDSKISNGNDFTLSTAQQVLVYGEVTSGPGSGELHPIHITNSGDVEVEIADFVKGATTSADSFPVTLSTDGTYATSAKQDLHTIELEAINTGVGSIDDKVILGQQTSANSVAVTIASDQTAVNSKVIGEDYLGTNRNIMVDTTGRLMVQVDAMRENGSETLNIPDATTGTSSEIQMGSHTRIAFYGDTDNTTNTNIFIEYSQDGVNWFRGAGDNAKVIIVASTGNFYDEEIITPPRVRISRPNTSGSAETLQLYYTRL